MFYEFAHRQTPCTVDGNEEAVILSRDPKSTTLIAKEYQYVGRFSPISIVQNGSLVESEESFFVQAKRKTTDNDFYCNMIKTNASINVLRYGQPEDVNGNPDGVPCFIPVVSNAIAYAQFVNADLRQQDIGLLATTEYILVVQNTIDIKRPNDPSLYRPDRVVLNGRNYQVDVVDDVKLPNMLHVQLSVDSR